MTPTRLPEGQAYLYQINKGEPVELPNGTVVKGGYNDGLQSIVYKGTTPIVCNALMVVKRITTKDNKKNALPELQHPVVKHGTETQE